MLKIHYFAIKNTLLEHEYDMNRTMMVSLLSVLLFENYLSPIKNLLKNKVHKICESFSTFAKTNVPMCHFAFTKNPSKILSSLKENKTKLFKFTKLFCNKSEKYFFSLGLEMLVRIGKPNF